MFVLPKPFKLENHPTEAPDLIIRLTIYGFNRLYPTYQLQTLEEISKQVTFKSSIQQQLSGDGEEGDKLKIFMELYEKSFCSYERHNVYPFTVVKMLKQQIKDTHVVSSEHRLHFAESFLGLSVIWFKGQTVDVQRLVTEELSDIVEGSITDEQHNTETEEDFVLRIFTELCKKVDFVTQVQFLEFVEQKRPNDLTYCWHEKLLIKPQDSHSATELLSRLCIFGFSLLSTAYQQQKIQKISTKVSQHEAAIAERGEEESEKDFRMKTFTELLNKVQVDTRVQLFREIVRHFFKQKFRHPCLPIEFLRQQKLVQNLKEMMPESRQQSSYPEFLFGVSVLWFKTKCANSLNEPIHVLLGQVEIGHVMKFLDETEEDFRVRGFGEWFKKLPFKSQQRFVKYIQGTVFHDVGNLQLLHERSYPNRRRKQTSSKGTGERASYRDDDEYYPQFIKVKTPNLKVVAAGGAATTQSGGDGAIRHAWEDWMEE